MMKRMAMEGESPDKCSISQEIESHGEKRHTAGEVLWKGWGTYLL
jgi:hypothetical protein